MSTDEFVIFTNAVQCLILFVLGVVALNVSPKLKSLTQKLLGNWSNYEEEKTLENQLIMISHKYASNSIIIIDVWGKIIFWSKGAELMFGRKYGEIMGKKLLEIIPPQYHKEHIEGLKTYREHGVTNIAGNLLDVTALKSTGEEFHIELKFFLDKSIHGMDVFVAIIKDMTPIDTLRIEFKEEVRKMEEYEKIAKTGGWTWDLKTDLVEVTNGFHEIFETDDDEVSTSKYLVQRVHVDDRKQVNDIIIEAFESKSNYEVTYRIKRSNEEVIKIYCKARAIIDHTGALVKYMGIIQQIKN